MLLHVTMTHTAADCPAYDPAKMGPFIEGGERLVAAAAEMNIKVHNVLWGAPNHIAFALIESENMSAVGRWLLSMPIRQEFTVTPVQNLMDVIEMGKAMQAAAGR